MRNLVAVVALLVVLAACSDTDSVVTVDSTSTTIETTTTQPSSTTSAATSSTDGADSTTTLVDPTDTVPLDGGAVAVYFTTGDGADCSTVEEWARPELAEMTALEAALTHLVAGPTPDEIAEGAGSNFSAATADSLVRVTHDESGYVIVDLTDHGGWVSLSSASCSSAALLAQLNATVFQFGDVDRVRYELDGSCERMFNVLQSECTEFDRSGSISLALAERADGRGCAPGEGPLGDGRWFGFVADGSSDQAINFDLACWFTGAAAVQASAEDGEESPPPNDYYVRNSASTIRVMNPGPGATALWYPSGDPTEFNETDIATWLEWRSTQEFQLGVWIDTADGRIIRIVEQWVP